MRKRKYRKFKKKAFKLNPKFIWVLSCIILTGVILTGLSFAVYSCEDFKVKEKDIRSNVALSGSLKNKIVGRPLFGLSADAVSSYILKGHPEYRQVYVLKEFPSSVEIRVKKRVPFIQIKAKRFYRVDREAVVLSNGSAEPFPGLISVEFEGRASFFKRGESVNSGKLGQAFDLMEVLGKEQLFKEFAVGSLNFVRPQAAYFTIENKLAAAGSGLSGGDIRIIVGENDFERKIESLKGVVAGELKEKMHLVKYIDLRYKKVYIGFKR